MAMKNRGNYNFQPDSAGKTAARFVGVVHVIFGIFFAMMGLSTLPTVGLFGLPFVLAGGFFAWNGWRVASGKEPGMKTEKGEEREFVSDLKFDAPIRPKRPVPGKDPSVRAQKATVRRESRAREEENHDHIRPMGDTVESQLEQLRTLKEAGLYTEEEYREKRRSILK